MKQWYYYEFPALALDSYYCGDFLEMLREVPDGTADMVLLDPPYSMGKDKGWDVFAGKTSYLDFMAQAFREAERILRPNGTLAFWHGDLQKIGWLCNWLEENTNFRFSTWGVWVKPNHRKKIWGNPGPGNTLRSWFNISETCTFYIKGDQGTDWNRTGLELVRLDPEKFAPLREYFRRLQEYTGATRREIITRCGQNADHAFRWNSRQWSLPTRETYLQLVAAYKCEEWPGYRTFDDLREQRDRMTAEYTGQIADQNAARYVHNLGPDHCNIWTTTEPQAIKKRHPCQKPLDITQRIIETHTNPGGVVVDFFAGSGTTGVAALRAGRRFILVDKDLEAQQMGAAWIQEEKAKLQLNTI